MAFYPNRETWVEMDELASHRRQAIQGQSDPGDLALQVWRIAFDAQRR